MAIVCNGKCTFIDHHHHHHYSISSTSNCWIELRLRFGLIEWPICCYPLAAINRYILWIIHIWLSAVVGRSMNGSDDRYAAGAVTFSTLRVFWLFCNDRIVCNFVNVQFFLFRLLLLLNLVFWLSLPVTVWMLIAALPYRDFFLINFFVTW